MDAREVQHKLVILGDSSVGKSCITIRFARNEYSELIDPTIGAQFIAKEMTANDGTVIKFEIWDTAGQERYRSLAPMYYKGASAGIVVYDITSMESFEGAKNWIKELQNHLSTETVLALVGNKIDLGNRKVPSQLASDYASDAGVIFKEVSAKADLNINELFQDIANKVPKIKPVKQSEQGVRLDQKRQEEDSSWCC